MSVRVRRGGGRIAVEALCLAALALIAISGAAAQARPQGALSDLSALRREFADRLTRFGRRAFGSRDLDLAGRAVGRALEVLPDFEEALSLREQVERRRRAVSRGEGREGSPADAALEPPRDLLAARGRSRGWRRVSGVAARRGDHLLVESADRPAELDFSYRPDGRVYELSLGVRFDGGPDLELVFGRGRKGGGFAVRLRGSRLTLMDEGGKAAKGGGALASGGLGEPAGSAWHRLGVRVCGRWVRVLWDGKARVRGEVPREPSGRVALRVRGTARLRSLEAGPTPAAWIAARADRAARRGHPAAAASLYRRAVGLDPEDPTLPPRWAAAEKGCGRSAEALRILRGFVGGGYPGKARDPEVVARLAEARVEIARIEALEGELGRIEARYLDGLRGVGVRAFDASAFDLAERAFAEVLAAAPSDVVAKRYRLRVLSARRGQGGWVPVAFGERLSGWNVLEGSPQVRGGILLLRGDVDHAGELVREDLPEATRFEVRVSFRPHGPYALGFVLGTAGKRVRIVLRNVFREKNVTVEKLSGEVRYRAELGSRAPAADRWHSMEAMVDRNRLYMRVDGEAWVAKVFAQPLSSRLGFYAARLSEGEFRDPAIRFLADEDSYRRALGDWGRTEALEIEAEEACEMETRRGGSAGDFRAHAYNGRVLGGGWGGAADHFASYRFETFEVPAAVLHLRYAFSGGGERSVRVRLDDGEPVTLSLPPVPPDDLFFVASAPIGDLSDGVHILRITPGDPPAAVDLDRIVLGPAQLRVSERSGIVAMEGLEHFRIRVSPGVPLPLDDPGFAGMLETVYRYMTRYLGFEVGSHLTLNIISRECWSDPHLGGYATGDQLYVPMETATHDLATVVHELSHCFDFGHGYFPPWIGEGKSVPILLDFLEDTGKTYLGRLHGGRDARARAGRSSAKRLMEGGETLIQYWGTDRFPYRDSPLRGAAYDTSAYFFDALHRRYGRDWLRRFHARMQADLDRGAYYMPRADRVLANSVLVDYLSRAVGEDLRPLFREWGFRLEDIYRTGEVLEADCGDDGEEHLTEPGASEVSEWDEGAGGRGRRTTQGRFVYTFPVEASVERVELEARVRGDVILSAGGTPLGQRSAPEPGILARTLEKRALWAPSSRLALSFAAGGEGGGKGAADVAWIRVRAVRGP